jgi:hypothetical protein
MKSILIFHHAAEFSTVLTNYFIPLCLKYNINTPLNFQFVIFQPNANAD